MKYVVFTCALVGVFLLTTISASAGVETINNPVASPAKDGLHGNDETSLAVQKSKRIITLDEAIRLAISQNANLAAAFYEMEARQEAAQQTAILPNPFFRAEAEEFGGSGAYSGTDAMTSKIGISQEILLGGKLSKRKQLAEGEGRLAMIEREAQLVALAVEVSKRFLEVYIAQEKLQLAESDLRLAQASADVIGKRVASGEASPLEVTKFAIEVAAAKTVVNRMVTILDAARLTLAASWGDAAAGFDGVAGDFVSVPPLQDEDALLAQLKKNPTYRLLAENVVQAQENLQLAKAEAVPDLEVGGGIQRFEETNDHAYFLEVSIPVPFFDRNQGGIAAAQATLNKTKKEQEAGALALQTDLLGTLYRLQGVWENYLSMRDIIVPASEKVFTSVQKAYRLGEQDYLELLEAQRSLVRARNAHLELLNELWELKLEVDSLVGQPFI